MGFFIVGDIFEVVHMWITTFYQVLGNSIFFIIIPLFMVLISLNGFNVWVFWLPGPLSCVPTIYPQIKI